jgi:hypothetical protein
MHQKIGIPLTCNGWWDDNCVSYVPDFQNYNSKEGTFVRNSKTYKFKNKIKIGKRITSDMCFGENCSRLHKCTVKIE